MNLFGQPSNNEGYEEFQILVAHLRRKKASYDKLYDSASKLLIKALNSGVKDTILARIENEHRLKQQKTLIGKAVNLAQGLTKTYNSLWAKHPSETAQLEYLELMGYVEVCGVPELNIFISKHPMIGNVEYQKISEIDFSTIAEYLSQFAFAHGLGENVQKSIFACFPRSTPSDISLNNNQGFFPGTQVVYPQPPSFPMQQDYDSPYANLASSMNGPQPPFFPPPT